MGARQSKPIWGFGWVGWSLLPVAASLPWMVISGYPLRDRILGLIDWAFGWKCVYWFVSVILPGHSISTIYIVPPDPKFTLVSMCITLVAMHLRPRRFRWWEYLIVVAWGFICPIVFFEGAHLSRLSGLGWMRSSDGALTVEVVGTLMVITVLTRSVVYVAPIAAMTVACAFIERSIRSGLAMSAPPDWALAAAPIGRWAWHLTFTGVLLGWAVTGRFRSTPPHACLRCGYDMRASGDTCPECAWVRGQPAHGSVDSPRGGAFMIDTRKAEHRKLRFGSLAEARSEAERILAAEKAGTLRRTGNWSVGQVFSHVGAFMDYPFEGYPTLLASPPPVIRAILKLMKKKYVSKGMPMGVKIPRVPGGTVGADDVPSDEGARRLFAAIDRLDKVAPTRPNPIFGPLTYDEWKNLNLRHAELHFGFLHPG